MPQLIVQVENQPPWKVKFEGGPLDGGQVRIGRSASCEVVIEDPGVSRVHAVIVSEERGFLIEDADSQNGTYVNGARIERRLLNSGDLIRLGQTVEIEFLADEDAATHVAGRRRLPVPRLPAIPGLPAVPRLARSLLRLADPLRHTSYLLESLDPASGRKTLRVDERVTTVGREEPARLVLPDESVSRLHARFNFEGRNLFVTDLKSRNGTLVNGQPVLRAHIEEGDVVQFGDLRFQVARRERLAWRRVGLAAAGAAVLVALGLVLGRAGDYLAERAVVADAQEGLRAQAVASLHQGIAAFREGDLDYARGYVLHAADILQFSNLAPPGASLSHPEELFRPVLDALPPGDRDFELAKILDPGAAPAARMRLEGLSDREYVERLTRLIAIELGQGEGVPAGFEEQVWKFVSAYSGDAWFQRILDRSRNIHPMLKRELRDAHLPEVFCYVAWVESGLNPRALSHAGARGLWQFMESTARIYGLRVDTARGIDERTDVTNSTRAATRYIGNLIRTFGREQFMCALASYNRGESGVRRAMEKIPDPMMESSHKYWYLVEQGLLPRETSEYVAKVFAVRILAEDPARFGLKRP